MHYSDSSVLLVCLKVLYFGMETKYWSKREVYSRWMVYVCLNINVMRFYCVDSRHSRYSSLCCWHTHNGRLHQVNNPAYCGNVAIFIWNKASKEHIHINGNCIKLSGCYGITVKIIILLLRILTDDMVSVASPEVFGIPQYYRFPK